MDHPVLSNSLNADKFFFGTYADDDEEFQYLAEEWRNFMGTTEDDFTSMELSYVLQQLKEVAIETNKEWANKLGINESVAITCVKPSGTVCISACG
jgi:hypothetical protein